MRDAVVVAALRTPVGRRKGGLSGIHPADLSGLLLRALSDRTGVDPASVDDVIWGCVSQVGEQTANIGRSAVLAAGWPETVPAVTVDRQCGSSQQAVSFAAAGLMSGQYDLVVAGGVESMTRVPLGVAASVAGEPYGPAALARYAEPLEAAGLPTFHQGVGAELIARRWGQTRDQLDAFALGSHARAAAAQDDGSFDDELVPVEVDGSLVERDEGVRRESTLAALGALPTPFAADGVVTAGSASQISDGAAVLMLTTSEHAARLGLAPLARIHTAVVVGDDPVLMLTGPIPATAKALARSGLALSDLDVFEVNEAFAPVPLAWLAETGADPRRLNPLGGAIALGHPLGATGARLATTLVHHLRRTGGRYGLQTMCEGGGQANATIFERLG
ncbi:MAG: thiolase family protein [Actinomycetota bacterium]|nr:thiolase family protein [Actinomycetota bacterium]MDH5277828.1 thiolase family protein [Actinomycetota bacterium]